MEPRLKCG